MDWQQYFLQGTEFLFLGIGTYFDVKDKELPLAYLSVFCAFGIGYNVFWKYQSFKNLLIGVCIGGLFLLIGWITKEAIGYGDGLGLVILGIFEGWQGMIPIVFGAFMLSGIYGLWRIIGFQESGNDTMPFFPFLFISFIGVILL